MKPLSRMSRDELIEDNTKLLRILARVMSLMLETEETQEALKELDKYTDEKLK